MSSSHHDHDHDHDHHHGHDHHGHAHDHREHGHDHGHSPAVAAGRPRASFSAQESRQAKRMVVVLLIVGLFFFFELAGAIVAQSNVLQADALHLLMDVFALAMSLLAMRLAVRHPTPRFTFGLRRAEPIAAVFNALLVLSVTVEIISEGVASLAHKSSPRPDIMLVVSAFALVVNGVSAWLLHGAVGHAGHDHGHEGDHSGHDHASPAHSHGHALNLRGALLHLIGDALGAVAALVAAIVIRCGGSSAADPIASFFVAAILIIGAFRLLGDAVLVLVEAAPPHLPVATVKAAIAAYPGVADVHELHVWTLGAGHHAMTTHVRVRSDDASFGTKLSIHLRELFKSEYVTVQVESVQDACGAPTAEE